MSASSCPTLTLSHRFAGNGGKSWGKWFYFDNEWSYSRGDDHGDIDWDEATYKYKATLFEFFGRENFWNKEYEVVQKGSRDWTGTVIIKKQGSYEYNIPFYGYQISDSKKQGKEYGKFAIGDTLTLKSCIDSLEQGINYCLFKKYWFYKQFIEYNSQLLEIDINFDYHSSRQPL